ncbi:Putative peptidoglycan binding domain-containing protein [Yoonia tamlensis]|uniref:Putative peptidoglycan binding domain-containing protein n=1 Tax=Yoonia tamlensis TaxID=390270 RepID=A0A1I6HAJ4_9RHOB|nr:peptidoglycan-binding protein [Yoonia tamlensis]SFR51364.1 Putative peptidoglycan binding domain-containing protein [Yoonia tamlensis]
MRKLTLIAALSGFALPALADDAALLLGVERYQELRRVPNATDVIDSAQDLRRAGYDVTTLSNGTSVNMARLLNQFAQAATDADRLVVGLSGRFVTDGTRSWLLASDAVDPSYFGLADAVSIDSVLNVLAQAPGQAVLILGYDLDGTDKIGVYLREGVGDLQIPQGVTVLFGEPNATDGVVMEAITVPGANVMEFARDARWLNIAGYAPRALVMQPARDDDDPTPVGDPTQQFWIIAQQLNTADAYRDFALNYPRSPYASEARARLDEIENDPVRLAEIAEADLALTRNARRNIQRDLTLLEYNTRGVDGIFGQGSRRAIRNWQQSNGFAQTSFLTAEQISRIDAQASRKRAEIEAEEERGRAQAERLDRAYWEETGARGDAAGLRAYLNRYPDGIFADEARDAMASFDRGTGRDDTPSNQAAADAEADLRINPVLARLIESRLAQMGFNPGQVDGRFDNDTRGAISRYQTRSGLPATGYLSEPTLARLLADTFGR